MAASYTRQSLRFRLRQALPTDADFLAFVLDHFPEHARRISSAADVLYKENLLFELVDELALEAALLQKLAAAPPQLQRFLREPVATFVGREAELEQLETALAKARFGQSVICVLRGLGGIGKTELACKVAARLRTKFPLQFLIELRGQSDTPTTAEQALCAVLKKLHPTSRLPDHRESLMELYRQSLGRLSALLIADDARDAAQVLPLLPPAGCALLVSTRSRFSIGQLQRQNVLDLGALPRQTSVQLLRDRCGRLSIDEAFALAARCGDLPKALHAAAGLLENDPTRRVADYLRDLDATRTRLRHLRDLDAPDGDVEAPLALSYAALPEAAQAALRQLGVFPASFDLDAAVAVIAQAPEVAAQTIALLYKRCLLEWNAERNRYHLHQLVRAFAQSRLTEDEAREAKIRHARHYAQGLRAAEELYQRGHDGVLDGLRWFDAEEPHLIAAQAFCVQATSGAPEVFALCLALTLDGQNLLALRLLPNMQIGWYEAAVRAAKALGERPSEGLALANLGHAYRRLGRFADALFCYEQDLSLCRELGDRHGEGKALGSLGMAYRGLGDFHKARACYAEHLDIVRQAGDRRGTGRALSNLGTAYKELSDSESALCCYEQSLDIAREVGDRRGEGSALFNLALSLFSAGTDLDTRARAQTLMAESLRIHEEIGDPFTENVRQVLHTWMSEAPSR